MGSDTNRLPEELPGRIAARGVLAGGDLGLAVPLMTAARLVGVRPLSRWGRIVLVDDRLLALNLVEVLLLGLHELVARLWRRAQQLVELEVDRARVAVLRVLDEED